MARSSARSFASLPQGRPRVRSDFLPCYTGGIDAHGARGWTVRLNRFEGIWCRKRACRARGPLLDGSRGTLVERNSIVDGEPRDAGRPDLGADEAGP